MHNELLLNVHTDASSPATTGLSLTVMLGLCVNYKNTL